MVVVCPAVLLRIDMFDLQSGQRRMVLMQAAILTAIGGSLPDEACNVVTDLIVQMTAKKKSL